MQTLRHEATLQNENYRIGKVLRQDDSVITYLGRSPWNRLRARGYSGIAEPMPEVVIEEFFIADSCRRFGDGNVIDCSTDGAFASGRKKFRKEAEERLRPAKEADPETCTDDKQPLDVFDENNTTYFVYAFKSPVSSAPAAKPDVAPVRLGRKTLWIWLILLLVVVFALSAFVKTYLYPGAGESQSDGFEKSVTEQPLVEDAAVDMTMPEKTKQVSEETSGSGAPLSDVEKVDGRGGFDDNAEGYFSQHANTYMTANRDVYFDGYFSDARNQYPIMLKFEINDSWFPGVCWYYNIDYDTKLKMNVRFTEEEMIIKGMAGGNEFIMRFTPTKNGGWEGTAENGRTRLNARITPRRS